MSSSDEETWTSEEEDLSSLETKEETTTLEMVDLVTSSASCEVCRICLENDVPNNLIEACHCTGSRRWVHQQCIDRWRSQFSRWHVQRHRCQICRRDYRYPVQGFHRGRPTEWSDEDSSSENTDAEAANVLARQRRIEQRRRNQLYAKQCVVVTLAGSAIFVGSIALLVLISLPNTTLLMHSDNDNRYLIGMYIEGGCAILSSGIYLYSRALSASLDIFHAVPMYTWILFVLLFVYPNVSCFILYVFTLLYSVGTFVVVGC